MCKGKRENRPRPRSVQNIPKFRDSCDVMELLFSGKMVDKTRVHSFESLTQISKTFHEAYTIILFKNAAHQKPHWKCLVKYSAHFGAYFSFLTVRCRQDFGQFSKVVNKYLVFWIHRFLRIFDNIDIFPRLLNIAMVDNLEFW